MRRAPGGGFFSSQRAPVDVTVPPRRATPGMCVARIVRARLRASSLFKRACVEELVGVPRVPVRQNRGIVSTARSH